MSQTIKLKRSSVTGKAPLTTDLELGELAINTFDGKLFIKKDDGTASIIEVGSAPAGYNNTNWDTAYGWGNHASAGYLTSLPSHVHTIANVTGLQTALDGKVDDGQVLTNVPAGALFTDTVYTLPEATATARGGIEIFSNTDQTVAANAVSATAGRTYGIQLNSAGQAVVNVPWVDTNTNTWRPIHDTPVDGATTTSISSNWAFDNVKTAVPAGALFTDTVYTHPSHPGDDFSVDTGPLTGATVVSDIDINVTTDTLGHVTDANGVVSTRTLTLGDLGYTGATNANNYVLPEATATARGGIELFSNTDQAVAANAVTATAGRTYGLQLNSAGQAVVNVPWSDTNTVYTHPSHPGDDISIDTGALTGATVISDLDFNVTTDTLGHVTDANATISTRNLTAADVGAAPASHSHSNYLPNSGVVTHSGLVSFSGTGSTSGVRFNSTVVANDAFGIRANGTNNAGELEFYSTDDDNEPFVFRHYTTGQDGTGPSVEWARISNLGLGIGGATVIDAGRNLTNIGTISASGGISVSGYNTISSYAGNFSFLTMNGGTVWGLTNDGAGSGLDADLLDGLDLHTGRNSEANKVVRTDSNGYAQFGWINTTSGVTTGTNRIYASNDGYIRYVTNDTFRNNLGLWWSGNDGSGSGLDADLLDGLNSTDFYRSNNPSGYTSFSNTSSEHITYRYRIHASDSTSPDSFGDSNRYQTFNYGVSSGVVGPLISFGGLGSNYPMQLTGHYSSGGSLFKMRTRNGDTNSWNSWRTIWHDGNDGSGSGLDADLLDGQHGSYYAPASHNHSLTLSGDVSGSGSVSGTISVTVNNDSHSHSNYLLTTGKAADSNLLDGIDSGSFLRSDATDYLNGVMYVRADIRNETAYRDHGVYGDYDSTKTNHIWSMGSSYRNSTDGSTFGTLYGLAYKHTNNPTGGTMGGSHQMVWCNNGSPRGAIGYDRVWHASGMRVGSSDVWHGANDGSGSGLDADLLDGQQGSYYLSTTGKAADSNLLDGIDSSRVIYGSNATGTTSNVNPTATLKSGFYDVYNQNTPTATWYSYINIRHNNTGNNHGHQVAGSFYDTNLWSRNISNNTFGAWTKKWDTANDGSGSGLDADLLDGQHGSYYAPNSSLGNYLPLTGGTLTGGLSISGYNAFSSYSANFAFLTLNNSTVWALTNDGAGSGLDADLLDGQQGSYYAPASHSHSYLPLSGGSLTGNLNLPRANAITFYGNGSNDHSIMSRSWTGAEADDIRINSYGGITLNLDSNNNNTSGKGLILGRHGASTGSVQKFIEVAGETCWTQMYDTSGGTGFTYMSFKNATGATTYGSIYRAYSSITYATSSDYRLKENIVDLTGASERLKQIPAKRFNFIEHPERTVDGFIAHEVQEIVPEAVVGDKDALDEEGNPVYQGVDQSKLVPLLVASLQEALAEIDNLKARVSALEN